MLRLRRLEVARLEAHVLLDDLARAVAHDLADERDELVAREELLELREQLALLLVHVPAQLLLERVRLGLEPLGRGAARRARAREAELVERSLRLIEQGGLVDVLRRALPRDVGRFDRGRGDVAAAATPCGGVGRGFGAAGRAARRAIRAHLLALLRSQRREDDLVLGLRVRDEYGLEDVELREHLPVRLGQRGGLVLVSPARRGARRADFALGLGARHGHGEERRGSRHVLAVGPLDIALALQLTREVVEGLELFLQAAMKLSGPKIGGQRRNATNRGSAQAQREGGRDVPDLNQGAVAQLLLFSR